MDTIYQRPAELLQRLIRFDTTNPPGREAECVQYIAGLLAAAGISYTLLAKDPERPNLIARLPGQGKAPPLLLQGHVDVVTTENQNWSRPPFAAELADGYVWGRGALDMKGGVAMMLAAFLRAQAEAVPLPGDVVLCILSDEEAGGDLGARFLVEEHPEQFAGIRYAIGEFGAFPLYVAGKKFYPIMVAEKQVCWMRATLRGPGGHGSTPVRGGAMARLSKLLQVVDGAPFPTHVTPVASQMITAMAAPLGFPAGALLRMLLKPGLTKRVLRLLGEQGATFHTFLHNTVSATMLQGSQKMNVIPSEVAVGLDCRLLPGYTPREMEQELRAAVGPDLGRELEFEVVRYDPCPANPDMGLFDTLVQVLRAADPDGIPIPMLFPAVTDGRHFARLGIQTYGYLPMNLPPELNLPRTVHAADERIPAAAVTMGANAIFQVLQRFQ